MNREKTRAADPSTKFDMFDTAAVAPPSDRPEAECVAAEASWRAQFVSWNAAKLKTAVQESRNAQKIPKTRGPNNVEIQRIPQNCSLNWFPVIMQTSKRRKRRCRHSEFRRQKCRQPKYRHQKCRHMNLASRNANKIPKAQDPKILNREERENLLFIDDFEPHTDTKNTNSQNVETHNADA